MLTGCYPHLIISHLKRSKLDPNRNILEGACGNPLAEQAYTDFHDFIAQARNIANTQFNNNSFFVDLHGHGNPIQRIELGYLLYDDELELPENTLNSTQYINYSSIKNLVLSNQNNLNHIQLLRGPQSLGTLLGNRNYPSVPSTTIPYPGINTNYFSGGYITANHTCYSVGVNINGLQMELNFSGIRDNASNRSTFAGAFCESIIEYLNAHFNMNWSPCNPLNQSKPEKTNINTLYPNPACKGETVVLQSKEISSFSYIIFNQLGISVKEGNFSSSSAIEIEGLDAGIYFVKITEKNGLTSSVSRLVLQ